jgi:hypothetical protein
MKKVLFLIFIALGVTLSAQTDVKPLCKSWKIVKYELFGVSEEPGEERILDELTFGVDKTFTIIEKGKTYKGTYIFNSGYIVCTSLDKQFKRSYRIVEAKESTAVVEYKDPDLIKTKYYLELK